MGSLEENVSEQTMATHALYFAISRQNFIATETSIELDKETFLGFNSTLLQ